MITLCCNKYWIQKRTECNWGILVLRWAVFTLQLETYWTFHCLFLFHFGAKNFEDWHQDVTGCICLRRNRVKLRRFLQDLFESLESCGSKIWIHSIYAGLHEFSPICRLRLSTNQKSMDEVGEFVWRPGVVTEALQRGRQVICLEKYFPNSTSMIFCQVASSRGCGQGAGRGKLGHRSRKRSFSNKWILYINELQVLSKRQVTGTRAGNIKTSRCIRCWQPCCPCQLRGAWWKAQGTGMRRTWFPLMATVCGEAGEAFRL